jgi:hypothetical protein
LWVVDAAAAGAGVCCDEGVGLVWCVKAVQMEVQGVVMY